MSESVDAIAAAWALRHPLDARQQAEMEAWLAQDRRHAGALLRAQAGLAVIGDALEQADDAGPVENRWTRRRWMAAGLSGTIAAGLAGAVGLSRFMGQHVATERGEIRRLPLADGSVAHTACVGFGLERIALALFAHHGLDVKVWPELVRKTLWG